MASRTTAQKVRSIIEIDDAIDITPFLDTANIFVTTALVNRDDPTKPHYNETTDAAQLAILEMWIGAHFTKILAPQTYDEEADQVIDRFDTKVDLGLLVTRYGQQAVMLDTKGILAEMVAAFKKGGPIRASAVWLGRPIKPVYPLT